MCPSTKPFHTPGTIINQRESIDRSNAGARRKTPPAAARSSDDRQAKRAASLGKRQEMEIKEATTHRTKPTPWPIGFLVGCLLCFCLPRTALRPIDGPQSHFIILMYALAARDVCVLKNKRRFACRMDRQIVVAAGRFRNIGVVLIYMSIQIARWWTWSAQPGVQSACAGSQTVPLVAHTPNLPLSIQGLFLRPSWTHPRAATN